MIILIISAIVMLIVITYFLKNNKNKTKKEIKELDKWSDQEHQKMMRKYNELSSERNSDQTY